jgi:hypothetical protein
MSIADSSLIIENILFADSLALLIDGILDKFMPPPNADRNRMTTESKLSKKSSLYVTTM